MVPAATVVTSGPATLAPARLMHVPVPPTGPPPPPPNAQARGEPGPAPARQQPSGSRSVQSAEVVSVVKSRIWSNSVTVVSPAPPGPVVSGPGPPPEVPVQLMSGACDQVIVWTGTLTAAFAVP